MQGLVGLVTGGASGLGRATVERFVREGAKVVICDLPKSPGEEVAAKLSGNAVFVPSDVRHLLERVLQSYRVTIDIQFRVEELNPTSQESLILDPQVKMDNYGSCMSDNHWN